MTLKADTHAEARLVSGPISDSSSATTCTRHADVNSDDTASSDVCHRDTGASLEAPMPSRRSSMSRLRRSPLVHKESSTSYLSSERITQLQHSGVINLGMVIVLATNSRLILENIIKYGLRANPLRWLHRAIGTSSSSNRYTLLGFVALGVCIFLAYANEFLAVKLLSWEQQLEAVTAKKGDRRSQRRHALVRAASNCITSCLCLVFTVCVPVLVPVATSYASQPEPLPLAVLTFCAMIVWMKLISYAMVNADFRSARRACELRPGERGFVAEPAEPDNATTHGRSPGFTCTMVYPENITTRNLLYFVAAPTLCYQHCLNGIILQMEYPRSPRIRVRWLCRRVAELVMYLGLMLFLVDQYVEPAILNSLRPLRDSQPVLVVERVLKLSLPCMYVWLCMFYLFFHLWLNIVAELTRFGDRVFYRDFWNACTIGEYWRLWNIPVHKWMISCVYAPIVRSGAGKLTGVFMVFLVSAAMHELAVGVPLRMLRYWAFAGMMAQLPMITVTEYLQRKLKNKVLGNVIFWLSFCIIGQPICALLYYHDYLLEHSPQDFPGTAAGGGAA